MGPRAQEANTLPHLLQHLLWSLMSVQQPRSFQESQVSPAKFSTSPSTVLVDRGAAGLCIKNLTAQDGVGSGAFSTACLPKQSQSHISGGGRRLPAWKTKQRNNRSRSNEGKNQPKEEKGKHNLLAQLIEDSCLLRDDMLSLLTVLHKIRTNQSRVSIYTDPNLFHDR